MRKGDYILYSTYCQVNLPGIQNCIFWRRGESVREKSKGGRRKGEGGRLRQVMQRKTRRNEKGKERAR